MVEGKTRRWIEGGGQIVTWANCHGVELLSRNGDEWVKAEELESSMRGQLPRNWALHFAPGKVIEMG